MRTSIHLLLALATTAGAAAAGCASDPPPSGDHDGPVDPDADDLAYRQANLTYFTSYPEPDSEECTEFNGCAWAGHFAFVDGQMSEEWVQSHNIAAVRSDYADTYRLKTLHLRGWDDDGDERELDVTVYDICSDSDCDGCCSRNSAETGFLIDLEVHTAERFDIWGGVIDWACLDCP